MNLPVVASEHGHDVNHLMVLLHWLMGILAVGWTVYFVFVLLRFRASRNKKANYAGIQGHASTWLEVGVASFEAVLLVGFAVPLWAKVVSDFPPENESTVIRVVAEQFGWNYIFPGKDGKFGPQDFALIRSDNPFGFDTTKEETKDNFTALNEVHVPVGKHVIMNFSSKDVIHSFKVVPLRVTQDCIPGVSIPVHFKPTMKGKFQVICAQLCGNAHAAMANGLVVVESQEDFEKWAASKVGAAATFE